MNVSSVVAKADAEVHIGEVGSSIGEVARQCQDALRKCLHIPPLMEYEWAENRLAEFNLWAAGTGAFAGERASLDSRLAVEWDTKNFLVSILILLLGCIEKCQAPGKISVLLSLRLRISG